MIVYHTIFLRIFFCTLLLVSLVGIAAPHSDVYQICLANGDNFTWHFSLEATSLPKLSPQQVRAEYKEGQLYLKLRENSRINISYDPNISGLPKHPLRHLIEQYGIVSVELAFKRLSAMTNYYKVKFEQTTQTDALIRALQSLPYVEFAERVPQHRLFYTPNDIHPNQYNVLTTQAEQAWDITTGNANIVIGMVDDAVRTDHEDLAANIWTNADEIPNNNIDDDGNGYIDDNMGWDAAANDNDPNPEGADNFSFSHGTHCAGIADAVTDNNIGIASVGFNVKLMPVKTALTGSGSVDAGMEGVEYAIVNNANVISMSWGGGAEAQTEQAVFDEAYAQGIVVVAAAGNDNTDVPMFPASYNHVISVAAINESDVKADFSNYGATIDVSAPGVQIWSTVATTTSSYEFYDGTSMACPYVSGLAALMLSLDPNATPDRIEQCLKETADDNYPVNPGFVGQLGAGRVNAKEAVQCTPSEPIADFTISAIPACPGETIIFTDYSAGTDITSWQWTFENGTPATFSGPLAASSFPAYGNYDVTLTVANNLGSSTITKSVAVDQPSAILSGEAVILIGYLVPIQVDFTGSPPYTFTYSNGITSTTISNINETPHVMWVSPPVSTQYNLTEFHNGYCDGTFSGTATVSVIVPTETNDECLNAYPFPDLQIGIESCVIGSNAAAHGELPYANQYSCNGTVVPQPAADVWYTVTAVSNILDVNATFTGMDTLVISMYEGTCDGLIGRDCAISTDGTLNTSFAPVAAGITYYLQVAGGSTTDFGDFTLCVENYGETIDEICMLGQSLVVDPLPTSGSYTPGQQVEFCFTVEGYNQNAADWFHGLVPVFGSAWDISTLGNFVIPPGCSSGATWDWYNVAIQGTSPYAQTIGPQGPGFFVETAAGGPGLDNFPGNNFGDPAPTGCGWEFCFTISTVASCPPGINGQDLSIIFRNFSDSETGSWGANSICPQDPEYEFRAVLACCAAPVMTGVDPTCANPFGGSIMAIATQGMPPFDFAWSNGLVTNDASFSSNENLPIGFYVVTVTDAQDCIGYASYTLTAAVAGFDLNLPPDQTICRGDSVQLSASNGVEYLWTPANSLSNSHIANPWASPQDTTTYFVQGEDAAGCTSFGQITVNVYDPIQADAGANQTICPGGSAQLTATGGTQYAWSPAASLNNPNIANPLATPAATTVYNVTVTNANGCVGTDKVTVLVSPPPFFPDLAVDTTVCENDTLVMQLTDINFISNYSYQWSPTTGLSNPNIPNPYATITESTDYSITVSNANGCTTVRTVSVNLNENEPIINLGSDTIVCTGTSFPLSAGNFETYLWSNGSTGSSISVSDSGTYFVRAVTSSGCVAVDTIHVSYVMAQVNLGADTTLCRGSELDLTAATGFAQYLWSDGSTSPSIHLTNAGTYSVQVTDSLGCAATDSFVFSYQDALPNIVGDLEGEIGEEKELTVAQMFEQYVWSTGDSTRSIKVAESGTYMVTVTDNLGCVGIDSVTTVFSAKTVFIVPNAFSPNGDNMNDIFRPFSSIPVVSYHLELYNRWGNEVMTSDDIAKGWDGKFGGQDAEAGIYVYFMEVTLADGTEKLYKGSVMLVR